VPAPDGELLVGGQALIEGVMMRSPGAFGVAVRRPDGSIALQRGKVARLSRRYPALRAPLLRGVATLFQSLAIGIRALNFSAEQAVAAALGEKKRDEKGGERIDQGGQSHQSDKNDQSDRSDQRQGTGSGWAIAGSMAIGLGLGVVVFLLLPLWLTQLGERFVFGPLSGLAFNLVDGGLRALFFLAYIFAISRFKDIHRVFMYHGAEHKVVFAYEKRLPLTVANARAQSRLHPRCGTSFLLFVLLVSIVVFALIPKSAPFLVKFGGRLLLVPLVAGLSYEVLRATARRRAAPFFAAMVFPGLALQKITTQEPTDDMLEVAIVALEEALREDGLLAPVAEEKEEEAPAAVQVSALDLPGRAAAAVRVRA
jgi:uncharacterized protein YqhQ